MAHAARLNLRLQKELKLLLTDPPPGASFPFLSDGSDLSSLSTIDAQIEGPEDTVYTKGIFHIKIQIPERYPFQPPIVAFATPIYHPNIDNGGRICLDILNLPPKGAWQPSLNISTVITSIGLLLREPNPDDGLMREASREYKYNRQAFDQKARFMTEKYARTGLTGQTSSTNCSHSILNTEVEVRRHLEESNCIITDSSASEKKPFGIRQKLSIESSSSTNKKDDNEVVSPDLTFDHKSHMGAEEGRKGLTGRPDDVCDVIGEKPCANRKKLSLGSTIRMHKREDHVTKDEKSKHLCSSPNLNNVSTGTTHKKLCLVDRKLAVQSRSLYKRQEGADKENAMPFKLLTSSNSKGMEKPEIGQKLGGGHLVQLQGCNEDSNGVYLHSLKQQHESERQEARLEKEAEVGESGIVLDSEESDEEESSVLLARRSKLSLGRRCVAKRKTKA